MGASLNKKRRVEVAILGVGMVTTALSFNGLIFVVHLASRRNRRVVDMTGLYINTMHVSYQMREMNK